MTQLGDTVLAFNAEAATDVADRVLFVGDILTAVGTFEDAVDQGYLSFGGDAASTTLSVDNDGSAGPEAAVVAVTFSGIAFVDSATSEALFADNINV